MEKIAIVGAGLIGRAWAIVFARAGHPVSLFDADWNATQQAVRLIAEALADLRRFELISEAAETVQARVTPTSSLADALDGAAYVQENIRETLEAKKEIYSAMDGLTASNAILASSTSTIPTSVFASDLNGKARCLVAHPVNPPHLVPVVEISPAAFTSADVVQRTHALLVSVGQVPILVKKELQGFILNRLQAVLLCEAFRLVEDDFVSVEDVDKCLKDGLGLRWSLMGPFETIDLNAPGGVLDYANRFGANLAEIDASPQSAPRRWNDRLVKQIDAQRRKILPQSQHSARETWRDRRLMALMAHKRAQANQENS